MSVFIGYPSFMAYQMMKGKKDNNEGFPTIPGMIARYSALGLTNEQMATNPVWVDKTGNGHDLQMKNFAWKGMSGVNGYKFDFLLNEWATSNDQISEKYSYKIVINNKQNSVQLINNSGHIKITLKITGIEINKSIFRVYDNAGMEHKHVVRAVTSEGKVYDENWNEYNIVPGNISSNYTMVNLGFDGSNQFAESATKLAGIYSSILSKDDCIKAYNYLQTLKAK